MRSTALHALRSYYYYYYDYDYDYDYYYYYYYDYYYYLRPLRLFLRQRGRRLLPLILHVRPQLLRRDACRQVRLHAARVEPALVERVPARDRQVLVGLGAHRRP